MDVQANTVIIDDSDDEFYEPLMDDNESSAISDLLVYLENVLSVFPEPFPSSFLQFNEWN